MIVAFLADVHGNARALDAVLADLPSVDAIVCCGDLVGYYPDAGEVVDRLRTLAVGTIRGNHELMLGGVLAPDPQRASRYRIEWTRAALDAEQRRWLAALPRELEFECNGLSIRVRHASPWDESTYVYPDSPALDDLRLERDRWLVLGHTHYPLHRRCGDGWIANPGSVGQPRDWDPRAAYGLLDTGTGRWRLRRVAYDHVAYQQRLEALGWEHQTIAMLSRTRACPAAV